MLVLKSALINSQPPHPHSSNFFLIYFLVQLVSMISNKLSRVKFFFFFLAT